MNTLDSLTVAYLQGESILDQEGETIYLGETFVNQVDLTEKIRDIFVQGGWTVVEDAIASLNLVKLKGSDNGHDCYFSFSTANPLGNTIDLAITAYTPDVETEATHIQRTSANLSKLYITVSPRSFCLLLKEKTRASIPYFGGFPEREDPDDAGAVLFGDLSWRMSGKFIQSPKYVSGDWLELKKFYYTGNEPTTLTSGSQGCYQGFLDGTVNILGANQSNSASQSAYQPQKGSLTTEGQAKVEPCFLNQCQFLQGEYAHLDSEATAAPRVGTIDFAVRGLGAVAAGENVITKYSRSLVSPDGTTHVLYYKDTYISGDIEYQGFLIDHQVSQLEFT